MKNKILTPDDIFNKIINSPQRYIRTYVICGKSGPTGKTYLWDRLTNRGLSAVEISEQINTLVQYDDDQNHYFEPTIGNAVVIVLNKLIKESN